MSRYRPRYGKEPPKKKSGGLVLIGIVGLLLFTGGIVAFSTSTNDESEAKAPSVLVAPEKFFDFGTISMAKGKVTHDFTISNPGADLVVIKMLYTSCMCTKATLIIDGEETGPFGMLAHGFAPPPIQKDLAPGASATIRAVFDPAAHGPAGVGPIARTVYVKTEDNAILKLDFKALVTP